jgi:hypothetical protein
MRRRVERQLNDMTTGARLSRLPVALHAWIFVKSLTMPPGAMRPSHLPLGLLRIAFYNQRSSHQREILRCAAACSTPQPRAHRWRVRSIFCILCRFVTGRKAGRPRPSSRGSRGARCRALAALRRRAHWTQGCLCARGVRPEPLGCGAGVSAAELREGFTAAHHLR